MSCYVVMLCHVMSRHTVGRNTTEAIEARYQYACWATSGLAEADASGISRYD